MAVKSGWNRSIVADIQLVSWGALGRGPLLWEPVSSSVTQDVPAPSQASLCPRTCSLLREMLRARSTSSLHLTSGRMRPRKVQMHRRCRKCGQSAYSSESLPLGLSGPPAAVQAWAAVRWASPTSTAALTLSPDPADNPLPSPLQAQRWKRIAVTATAKVRHHPLLSFPSGDHGFVNCHSVNNL